MRRVFSLTALLLVLALTAGGCSSPDEASDSPFVRDVPAALQSDIDKRSQNLSETGPLSEPEKEELRQTVAGIKLKYPATNKTTLKEDIRKHGLTSIVVLGELLTTADPEMRIKAIKASYRLIRPSMEFTADYLDNGEPLLAALFHRSLVADKDPHVRSHAISGLVFIGQSHQWRPRSEPVPAYVKHALDAGMSDPNAKVRDRVLRARKKLGIAAPGDPEPDTGGAIID